MGNIKMKTVKIDTEYIKLNQFLKFVAIIQNGSDGKLIISGGKIKVNGEVENRRGKKLKKGDIVKFEDNEYEIV